MARGPWQDEADLVVVGASVGGLLAAILAADRGCRTVVLERGKELGGGAGSEAELIAAAGSRFQTEAGIEDAPARLGADIAAAARHHVEPDLTAAIVGQGPMIVAWLADRCGVPIALLAGYDAPGHSVARLHAPGDRGGAGLVAHLARAATRHTRVSMRTGVVADRLALDDAAVVTGVVVRTERRGVTQTLAGRVLLACGGFAAADEQVATHCGPVAALPYGGTSRADGEAMRLAREAGAQTRRLAACRVTPFLATPGQMVVSSPLVELGAVLINQVGRRFVDETGEALSVATAIRAQPGHVAYLLFDERIAAAMRAADPFFRNVVLPRAGRRGATLADLARQFELDAEGLALTIDTYNGNLDLGGDPFGRERFQAHLEPPLHAIRVTGARLHTLGGLAIDGEARVLSAAGGPLPRLWAAGGAAVGLASEGTEGALVGTETLAALALGRLAALAVVSEAAAAAGEVET